MVEQRDDAVPAMISYSEMLSSRQGSKIEVDKPLQRELSDQCSIDVCFAPDKAIDRLTWAEVEWKEICPKPSYKRTTIFEQEIADIGICTHIRLNIYPDGGISRLRYNFEKV